MDAGALGERKASAKALRRKVREAKAGAAASLARAIGDDAAAHLPEGDAAGDAPAEPEDGGH